jgi:hypothetical protein
MKADTAVVTDDITITDVCRLIAKVDREFERTDDGDTAVDRQNAFVEVLTTMPARSLEEAIMLIYFAREHTEMAVFGKTNELRLGAMTTMEALLDGALRYFFTSVLADYRALGVESGQWRRYTEPVADDGDEEHDQPADA